MSSVAPLRFEVVGHGPVEITPAWVLNGGYAGRDTEEVRHHVEELAAIGVPGPTNVPTMYPLSHHLAMQTDHVQVAHAKTSGEAEWAFVVPTEGEVHTDELLVVAACDHTDRALEAHGVAWSKQSAPDVLGDVAWRWGDVAEDFDHFTLRGWVGDETADELIQDGSPAKLLDVPYWAGRLEKAGLLRPGTVFMSGTIPMIPGVDQFAGAWRVELADGAGNVSRVAYTVETLPPAWE